MQSWLRRARGAIGMGVTWAFTWSAAGAALRWVFGVETDAPLPLLFGLAGLVAGVMFASVLALTERRRRFDQMSLPRFAAWGATGGLLLAGVVAKVASLGWSDVLALAPTLAVASAVCASGSLALARRAERRQLDDPAVGADVELTAGAKRELPGGDR